MEGLYFEELKKRYIMDAGNVNHYADLKDIERNRVNYGHVTAWTQMLQDFGHSTSTAVWEDRNGCLRIPSVSIDGKMLVEFHNGCKELE